MVPGDFADGQGAGAAGGSGSSAVRVGGDQRIPGRDQPAATASTRPLAAGA